MKKHKSLSLALLHLQRATKMLETVLNENPPLKQRVADALKRGQCELRDGRAIRRTHLLAFWECTGGWGIVLMPNVPNGLKPQVAVFSPKGRGKGESWCANKICVGGVWDEVQPLPAEIRIALLSMQTRMGMKKMLRFGLRK